MYFGVDLLLVLVNGFPLSFVSFLEKVLEKSLRLQYLLDNNFFQMAIKLMAKFFFDYAGRILYTFTPLPSRILTAIDLFNVLTSKMAYNQRQ